MNGGDGDPRVSGSPGIGPESAESPEVESEGDIYGFEKSDQVVSEALGSIENGSSAKSKSVRSTRPVVPDIFVLRKPIIKMLGLPFFLKFTMGCLSMLQMNRILDVKRPVGRTLAAGV